ncbi:MAG: prolyl oligopeptidase family serine peptidase [Candidatus Latescibacteria bacterium]|nr:prolyl oligopeptidase family serine peptidase [Candidatus Latescibacterota bacterium]
MEYDHHKDVVYGYKDGMGLVMDVLTPSTKRNGAAVLSLVSGGYRSSPSWLMVDGISPSVKQETEEVMSVVRSGARPSLGFGKFPQEAFLRGRTRFFQAHHSLLEAGYAVFVVAHSSSPKYRLDEIIPDISRAVRFIRHNAEGFGFDPDRIGIRGGSSGGGLSLMAAMAPPPPDPEHEDPVERVSSRIQAAVAYFSPTDLLNFGEPDRNAIECFYDRLGHKRPHHDFHAWREETQSYERVDDAEEGKAILCRCSAITHVSADSPPTLLLHGDEDELVPLQQSESLAARLREAGVAHKLIVAKGQGHGWDTSDDELAAIRGWFDRYLLEGGD